MRVLTIAIASLIATLSLSAGADPLGEHPAVLIKRHAATQPIQPAYLNFYMHPAHLQLLTQAPGDDEVTANAEGDTQRKVVVISSQRAGTTTVAY